MSSSRFIITVIWIWFAVARIFADADSMLAFADYLVKRGEYRLAITEYQRYQHQERSDTCLSHHRMGQARQYLRDFSEASRHMETVIEACKDDQNLVIQAHLDLVKDCIQRGEYRLAQFELNQVRQYEETASYQEDIQFLDILIDAHLYRIDSARAKIRLNQGRNAYKDKMEELEKLIDGYENRRFKHPTIAYTLSTFIPGSGQLYAGKKRHAIGAFILVSALSAAMVWSGHGFFTGDPREKYIAGADFLIFGLFVWYRYYDGSRRTAYEAALLHNRHIQLQYQEGLREIENFRER
jgi:tetratricopeptide (TPR) repeat protein